MRERRGAEDRSSVTAEESAARRAEIAGRPRAGAATTAPRRTTRPAALRGPGASLPASLRTLGPLADHPAVADVVHLHEGPEAAAAAGAVNATAFTIGNHVALGADAPAPGTEAYRRLLTHEFTHAVQQVAGVAPITVARQFGRDPAGLDEDTLASEHGSVRAFLLETPEGDPMYAPALRYLEQIEAELRRREQVQASPSPTPQQPPATTGVRPPASRERPPGLVEGQVPVTDPLRSFGIDPELLPEDVRDAIRSGLDALRSDVAGEGSPSADIIRQQGVVDGVLTDTAYVDTAAGRLRVSRRVDPSTGTVTTELGFVTPDGGNLTAERTDQLVIEDAERPLRGNTPQDRTPSPRASQRARRPSPQPTTSDAPPEQAEPADPQVEEVLRHLRGDDWDTDTLAAALSDEQLRSLSTADRIVLIRHLAEGWSVLNEDEQTILRLLRTTAAGADQRAVLDALEADAGSLLAALESAIDFDEYRDFHRELQRMRLRSAGAAELEQQMRSARRLVWSDPGPVRALYTPRSYIEEAEITDEGRIRIVMWANLAFMGMRLEPMEFDPMELVRIDFPIGEEEFDVAEGTTLYVPASTLLALRNKQFRDDMALAADVAAMGLGGAGVLSATTRVGRLLAAAELAFGAADIVVRDYRSELRATEAGRTFLDVWTVVQVIVAAYGIGQLVLSVPRLLRRLRQALAALRRPNSGVDPADVAQLEHSVEELLDQADDAAAEVALDQTVRGHTAEGVGDAFTHGPLPDPGSPEVLRRPGPTVSGDEVLEGYADARRSTEGRNPATAAARGDDGLPYIRDNLYTGTRQRDVTRALRRHRVIDWDQQTLTVLEPDRYLEWLERAYWHHGRGHMDPRVADAIRDYVGGGPVSLAGTRPSGGAAFGGLLPGSHAEVLAVNDALLGGAGSVDVATLQARLGSHFAACPHCAGILGRLAEVLPELRILTGVSGP